MEGRAVEDDDSASGKGGREGWADTADTTRLWRLIHTNDLEGLQKALADDRGLAQLRSSDGRGPLFWAYEHNRPDMAKLLKAAGASDTVKDAKGETPKALRKKMKARAKANAA